jgi:ABC-2 type transport system permease protein
MLVQREAVNDAWDLPKAATMEPFAERHPEWTKVVTPEEGFDWGWYYAFQQVGDQTVEPLSQAYREGRAQRDHLAGWSSLVSPATALQRILERLAQTDTQAAADYEQRTRNFHAELRAYYYPRLFEGRDFDPDNIPDLLSDFPIYPPPQTQSES